jgi:hypothetical protein
MAHGDFAIYLQADPMKPEGSRISVRFIDPGMVFQIFAEDDVDRVVGMQLVEQVKIGDKEYLKRQRWVKPTSPLHPQYNPDAPVYEGFIWYDSVVLELADWEDPAKAKIFKTEVPQMEIPGITQPPVYLFKNRVKTGEPYGLSELQGFERLFLAINQSVTDEDVTLAMQGLGVYASNTRPTTADGTETDWILGPRRVVELDGPKPDQYFERVNGVGSITPMQDHYKWLIEMAESTAGINEVAMGQVDTTVAESGVALEIRLGPIIDESNRKDERLLGRLKQLFFNLREWFTVYESITLPPEIMVEPVVGKKMPVNVEKEASRLQDLWIGGAISTVLFLTKLNELGFNLGDPATVVAEAQAEALEKAELQQQMFGGTEGGGGGFGDRLDQEAGGEPDADEA